MKYLAFITGAIFSLALLGQPTVAQTAVGVSMNAELTKGIDVKKAKVGDIVNARTTDVVNLPDGTSLPKGTKLMGKVTEVRAKSNSDKTSHLAFNLEQALTKDGHEIALRVMVTSVTVPTEDMPDVAGIAAGAHGGGATPASPGTAPTTASNPNGTYVTQSTIRSQNQAQQETTGTVAHKPNERVTVGNLPGAVWTSADGTTSSGAVDFANQNVWLGTGTKLTLFVAPQK